MAQLAVRGSRFELEAGSWKLEAEMPSFTLSPDAVYREIDEEAVILDLASGTYFGLNVVGTRIWQLIEAGLDERAIADALAAEFDADRAAIAADVARVLDDLRSRHLIVEKERDSRA
jgi:Coenzyme PQQ synthesis protein D (PqqD)